MCAASFTLTAGPSVRACVALRISPALVASSSPKRVLESTQAVTRMVSWVQASTVTIGGNRAWNWMQGPPLNS